MTQSKSSVVITGYGPGLGVALAQALLARYHVFALSRSVDTQPLPPGVVSLAADASDEAALTQAFAQVDQHVEQSGAPLAAVIHNPAHLVIQPFLETPVDDFQACWRAMVHSAVLVARQAIPRMLTTAATGGGTLIFSGATASIRGGARFAAFASAKFALRGLAQSLAREFQPQGIHVAHVILDGIIWSEKSRQRHNVKQAQTLQPEDIAATYVHLIRQPRSAWTQELDLRPASETF